MMFTLAELDTAAALIYRTLAPTPQYDWPLLRASRQRYWVGGTPSGAEACRRCLGAVEWIPDDFRGRRES